MINTNRSYLVEEFITIEVNLSPLKKFHRLPVPIDLLSNPAVLISVVRLFPFKKFIGAAANGLANLRWAEIEALHCQPSINFDRSTKLDLTTEPPLLGRCC